MGERSLGKHTGVVCRGVREGWDKGGEDGEGGIGEVQDRGLLGGVKKEELMGAASAQRSVLELLLLKSGFCCGGGKRLPLLWPFGMKSGCCGDSDSLSEDSVRLALLSKTACSACETDGMVPCVGLAGALVLRRQRPYRSQIGLDLGLLLGGAVGEVVEVEEVGGEEVVVVEEVGGEEVEEGVAVDVGVNEAEGTRGGGVVEIVVVGVEHVEEGVVVVALFFSVRRRHLPYRSHMGLGRLGVLRARGRAVDIEVAEGLEVVGGGEVVVVSIEVVEVVGVGVVGGVVVMVVVFVVVVVGVAGSVG